ncbi:NERD domain-containing protein [Chloroflexia bacterium SDU3-3]|nr:NERD domain-containing protein [Chloroflexia bacterium SDU3-3]
MAVQVWIGEKPEHPNERRAIVALANGLERLEGLYLILANFSVGGRAVDLVIIKQDAIFIIELKQCDGKVFGDVNGPWFAESSNGVRKRLNPGRKNPYNQVISYYYSLINFLNEKRGEFLSPNKSSSIDFRTCKRLIVIAPTVQEGSHVDIDWKVDMKGLDELPTYLVTERSSEIDLSPEEMQAIPELLHLTRWGEVNTLIEGVIPRWEEVGDEMPTKAAEPAPATDAPAAPAARPSLPQLARAALGTWTGKAAAGFAVLALALASGYVFRPPLAAPRADQPSTLLVGTSGPIGGTLDQFTGAAGQNSCTSSVFEWIGRKRDRSNDSWQNVGVVGAAPALSPDVVVTLEDVSFCDGKIAITWSLQNNMASESASLPLTSDNITISDEDGTVYTINDALSKPAEIRAEPNMQAKGVAVIDRPLSANSATLLITLKNQPFGTAQWPVVVNQGQ